MSAVSTGELLEEVAAKFLTAHKVRILERNFRCKLGEIDIIAQDNQCLIFAEVRFRKSNAYGSAAESVTLSKQQKIIRTAQFYLQNRDWAQKVSCRFDVIAISQSVISPHIEWIKDAFDA